MNLLTLLTIAAGFFFVAHVILLFTSFSATGVNKRKYFWSHATLWIFGLVVFAMAFLYAGQGEAAIIDVFNTPGKRLIILAVVALLSVTAHSIVKLFVLPRYKNS